MLALLRHSCRSKGSSLNALKVGPYAQTFASGGWAQSGAAVALSYSGISLMGPVDSDSQLGRLSLRNGLAPSLQQHGGMLHLSCGPRRRRRSTELRFHGPEIDKFVS